MPKSEPPMKMLWSNDTIQFARLLAEIRAAGLSNRIMFLLGKSMNLENEQIEELFVRAEKAWEAIKEKGYTHKILMRWGDQPIIDDGKDTRPVCEYTFHSLEEVNAFTEAVGEADGWLSGEEMTECQLHKESFYPTGESCGLCPEERPISSRAECDPDCARGGPDNCNGCMD